MCSLFLGGNFVAVVCDDGAVRIVDPFKGAVTHTMVVGDEMRGWEETEGLCVEPKGDTELSSPRKEVRLYDLHIARKAEGTPGASQVDSYQCRVGERPSPQVR